MQTQLKIKALVHRCRRIAGLLHWWNGLFFLGDLPMAKSDYYKKFKDPKWQKKRLKIMERDEFTCRRCKKADRTLNVHHLYYVYSCDPWEYPDECLVTLCEECHKNIKDIDYLRYLALQFLTDGYLSKEPIHFLDTMWCSYGSGEFDLIRAYQDASKE